MIWKSDYTGRFPQRPHWELEELEKLCEERTLPFLTARYGQAPARLPTDALTVLIEDQAEVLDLDADLISEDEREEIHGVTTFKAGERPTVEINRHLRRTLQRINRLRTTLAHEYGHLLLHAWLYEHFHGRVGNPAPLRCYSRTVEGNIDWLIDWMEWQAGYLCGALLMPRWRVDLLINAFAREIGIAGPLKRDSIEGGRLIERVTDLFDVSREAARVRLLKLGHLAT
jgi:Zn-dependent peptidase ImmA (M78 family)